MLKKFRLIIIHFRNNPYYSNDYNASWLRKSLFQNHIYLETKKNHLKIFKIKLL
jgi:hypothetical protein